MNHIVFCSTSMPLTSTGWAQSTIKPILSTAVNKIENIGKNYLKTRFEPGAAG